MVRVVDAVGPAALGETIATERVVGRLDEVRLAAIAALRDVMWRTGCGDAGEAGYWRLLCGGRIMQLVLCHCNSRMEILLPTVFCCHLPRAARCRRLLGCRIFL